MTTHDLLELASLDAMGLLDPEEREAFERAFRAAPPALQAQIRREQTRFADIDSSLPAVDPPPGLRARVIAAVRDAMQAVAATRSVAGRIFPSLRPATGVSRLWRIGAIGAAAAAIVFAFTTLQMRSDYNAIAQAIQSNALHDKFLKEFGPRFEQAMFDQNTRFVQFSTAPDADSAAGRAVLLLDPAGRKGQFFCKDLPALGDEYELVVVDDDGNTTAAVLSFRPSGPGVERHDIKDLKLEGARNLAIRRVDAAGAAAAMVLTSSKL